MWRLHFAQGFRLWSTRSNTNDECKRLVAPIDFRLAITGSGLLP